MFIETTHQNFMKINLLDALNIYLVFKSRNLIQLQAQQRMGFQCTECFYGFITKPWIC